MSARREVRVGDRVTIGKRRRRFTVVAIFRPVDHWIGAADERLPLAPPTVALVLEHHARHAYRRAPLPGEAGAKPRRVPLAKLARV